MNNFHEILNELTVPELKQCLPLLTGGLKPARKADIIEYIYNDCKQHCVAYWQKLDKLEKQVIAEMLYQKMNDNGQSVFDSYKFNAKYGEIPKFFSRQQLWGRNSAETANTSFLTLFIFNRKIPNEYREWLKTCVKKPPKLRIPSIAEDKLPTFFEYEPHESYLKDGAKRNPEIKILATEAMAMKDLESVLRFIESGQCAVSEKTQRPSAVTMRKLEAVLLAGDYYSPEDEWNINQWEANPIRPIRPFAWPLIIQSSGLAKRVGKKLQLTNNGKKALTAPLEKTVKTLYQRWRNKGLLDEFSRINIIKGQASKGRVMTAVPPRRKVIESILQQCPIEGGWTSIDSLFQYIKSSDYDFRVAHTEWRLYINDREYGALGYNGYHNFEVLEGRYILAYFFEYLATMGLIDIAYTIPYEVRRDDYHNMWGADDLLCMSRYDGLLYFRINPLGAYCLEMAKTYQPTVIEKPVLFTIDEALHIHLLRSPDPAETIMLERYSTPLSDTEWALTEKSLLRATDHHFTAGEFQQFLQDNSAQEQLPAEVNDFFQAAFARENALKDIGSARLLHCYSESFADMLANNKETNHYCTYAGGKLLIIPEKMKQKFIQGLHKLGYTYPEESN